MDLNKKNKIAFLITGLQAGGAERVISNLANNFAEKNYDVKIIVMKKAVSDYALNPNIDFAGADAVGKEGKNNFGSDRHCRSDNRRVAAYKAEYTSPQLQIQNKRLHTRYIDATA